MGWAGPGHLCEAEFTLRVEPSEYAREDIQLEPSYPPSITIKSAEGWYTISILLVKPPRPESAAKVRATPNGAVYRYSDNRTQAAFVFIPNGRQKPAIKIVFWNTADSAEA